MNNKDETIREIQTLVNTTSIHLDSRYPSWAYSDSYTKEALWKDILKLQSEITRLRYLVGKL